MNVFIESELLLFISFLNQTRSKSWYESNTRASAKPLFRERRPYTSRSTTAPPAELSNHKLNRGEDVERDTSAESASGDQNASAKVNKIRLHYFTIELDFENVFLRFPEEIPIPILAKCRRESVVIEIQLKLIPPN